MCKDALLQVKEKRVVARNRGGNIPKEPIVAHSVGNPPHSFSQWMPTTISSFDTTPTTREQRSPDNSDGGTGKHKPTQKWRPLQAFSTWRPFRKRFRPFLH
ncbi:hypothetical protein HZH68_007534 [Vespula germanica]|uniref:Uncharacterized protein n=1 Tax=Vespula germanica TaxID=30212 RepID=A0A834KB93_VESGE|nr:hypothetical protein HZH68_007534 [Vespula germanica]